MLWAPLLWAQNASTPNTQSYEFKIGEKLNIVSDKALRKTKDNFCEAIGNVIITHKANSIYGEKASVDLTSGDSTVVGNVRYVSPEMTLVGTKLEYNFISKILSVENARISTGNNFVINGKKISRISNNQIVAIDSEYSTCRDCPESWSFFGKYIHLTLGEYVRITHAFLKVNGVVVMYFPYMVLPVKNGRETGLLFPHFGYASDDGSTYKQPWFWAIGAQNDLTLTPSFLSRRGMGNEFQFRQVFGEKKWFEINSLQTWDKIYTPNKPTFDESGTTNFRHFSDFEEHYHIGHDFSHHLYYSHMSDLDIIRDYTNFPPSNVLSSEAGGGGYFDFRKSLFNISLAADFNRNQIFHNAKGFDHNYVQILPEVNLDIVPVNLLQTDWPIFSRFSFDTHVDYTIFKQNHYHEALFIRNASRLNATPSITVNVAQFGPIDATSSIKFDQQYYHFSNEEDKSFAKTGMLYENQLSFGLEKRWGISYQKEITKLEAQDAGILPPDLDQGDVDQKSLLIANIPKVDRAFDDEKIQVEKNSYRHYQYFKLKHYYLDDQSTRGNNRFLNQIKDGKGQFDPIDALRAKENQSDTVAARRTLPLNNTLEFIINNSLIKKTPKKFDPLVGGQTIWDNFGYSRIAYFDISQGWDLQIDSKDPTDHLTRLMLTTGLGLGSFGLSANEYYYYRTKSHDTTLSFSFALPYIKVNTQFRYDSFSTPSNRFISPSVVLIPSDIWQISSGMVFDVDKRQAQSSSHKITYSPKNNCWKFEVGRRQDPNEIRYGFNFMINFNENVFVPLFTY